jgi:diguanylate cyclase (GGDEF)-like protein
MLGLLKHIESISACRDREILASMVAAAVHETLGCNSVTLYRWAQEVGEGTYRVVVRSDDDGLKMQGALQGSHDDPATGEDAALLAGTSPAVHSCACGFKLVFPLAHSATSFPQEYLLADSRVPPQKEDNETVARFLAFYTNYLYLLDYSELDTLTGLLNRKTFDESFDRLLSEVTAATDKDGKNSERRAEKNGCWIGIVDIDKFKRINDNFGHLFGDEVLLRTANLLKKCFRQGDRLFRFGGEEFIVMLRNSDIDGAYLAFDRFRATVESSELPQVGKVTCSVGFSHVDPMLAPVDILGEADTALYYAKEHGRNQVHCYGQLVARELIEPKHIKTVQPEIFDIDSLFS